MVYAGCGARTSLALAEDSPGETPSSGGTGGSSGAAGASGAGGSAGSATGGTGGAACTPVERVLPVVEVEGTPETFDANPRLVPSSDDGQQVTLAFARMPVEGPAWSTRIHHTPLRPWQTWPDSPVGPLHDSFAHPDLQQAFAVGQSPGSRFGLLVSHVSSASFAPVVDPGGASVGPTTTVDGSSPLFVRHGWGGHLLGTLGESGEVLATVVVPAPGPEEAWIPTSTTVLGCADMAPVSSAEKYGADWLVALSNGQNTVGAGCAPTQDGPGLPNRLDVVRVDPGGSAAYVLGLQEDAPIAQLVTAPHPNGIWVLWTVATGAPSPIRLARFEPGTGGLIGPYVVTEDFSPNFDAVAWDGRLAVVWHDALDSQPALTVAVLDDAGAELATGSVEVDAAVGSLSMVGSPDGESVLVAWTGWPTPELGSSRVQLARIDCIP